MIKKIYRVYEHDNNGKLVLVNFDTTRLYVEFEVAGGFHTEESAEGAIVDARIRAGVKYDCQEFIILPSTIFS
jgi:CO dehydrogenase/acetyl-CoA synthase gamma subunit (corrinoid Fe-S protein)